MRRLVLLLLVLLGWLQYSLWMGKNGVHDLIRINHSITEQQNNNTQLKARNEQLLVEINDLNNGQEAIEERSRNELGMIKSGEAFYRLVPEPTKQQLPVRLMQDKP